MSFSKKKTDPNTIFLKYSPPISTLTRLHLETICSDIGPVKKCSLIRKQQKKGKNNEISNRDRIAAGFAFVKFLSQEDAREAVKELNKKTIYLDEGKGTVFNHNGRDGSVEGYTALKLIVELASDSNTDEKEKIRQTEPSKEDTITKQDEVIKLNKSSQTNKHETNKTNESKSSTTNASTSTETTSKTDENANANANANTVDEFLQKRKRTSRLILRNLSFYASPNDVKKVMQNEFGPVLEVNLPLVPGKKFHRGFAFVTFENALHAKNAVDRGTITIKKRQVAIDYSVSKMQHQRMQKEEAMASNDKNQNDLDIDENEDENKDGKLEEDQSDNHDDDVNESNEDSNEKDSNNSDTDDNEDDNDDDDDDDDDEKEDNDSNNEEDSKQIKQLSSQKNQKMSPTKADAGIIQHRTLFLRNLPYDCTRHDIFQLFAPYGTIKSIYMVKDRETGIKKGTAFLEYQHSNFAKAAMSASGCDTLNNMNSDNNNNVTKSTHENHQATSSFLYQTTSTEDGIHLQGRRIFMNYAVDKQSAASLTADAEQKKIGKDKRNLYLKNEGRVGDKDGWEDELLDSDREKRGRAHNEKSQKLRSPLFFINSMRLSIRNLAKHINDETQLRTLVVEGLAKGLERKLVSKEDVWLHFRAKGEEISRSKILEMEIPDFDPKQIKQSIPSIYIDKDQVTSNSKGFAFVEFTHHAHALACLRQVNNNPQYSKMYAAGGKKAALGNNTNKKVPRLIVEFTVENKAKAKLQADRRARQLQNVLNQKKRGLTKGEGNDNDAPNDPNGVSGTGTKKSSKKKKRPSRGALQREKKRKLKAEQTQGEQALPSSNKNDNAPRDTQPLKKSESKNKSKPPKRQKIDKEDQAFENMVQSYKSKFMGNIQSNEKNKNSTIMKEREDINKRRWFD